MQDEERRRRERAFFDASSAAQFDAEPPLPNEHMVALLDLAGDVRDKRILDCGCGSGELSLALAERGAQVFAFDLSGESVRLMNRRATLVDAPPPAGIVSVMERLPFPDHAFDVVVGKSILHHVDVAASMEEVRRVLVPGGRGVFVENQVTNPLLRVARERLTGRFGIARVGTIDEHPLVASDYAGIRRLFPVARLHYPDFRFFSLISRNVLKYKRALWLARALARLDAFVYRRLPPLRRWGYHVIVEVQKAGS